MFIYRHRLVIYFLVLPSCFVCLCWKGRNNEVSIFRDKMALWREAEGSLETIVILVKREYIPFAFGSVFSGQV